ncbi:MAG TPA: hypothetical protein VFB38_02745 [Chthonomonadaceae bacterium]|nr:hypothetical protein [Chthonomonadaceae bacterium]
MITTQNRPKFRALLPLSVPILFVGILLSNYIIHRIYLDKQEHLRREQKERTQAEQTHYRALTNALFRAAHEGDVAAFEALMRQISPSVWYTSGSG